MISTEMHARLRAVDPDRYRSALLADETQRERLMVIYAFHSELAKIPELVSETMIGEIRYQWWRDVVEEIYKGGAVRSHEVATPLSTVLRETNVPRFWVDRLIDGRARDLDPTPFVNMEAARDYTAQTSGLLAQIAAHVLAPDFDSDGAAQAGQAWGMTGLARAYRYYHAGMLSQVDFADILAASRGQYQLAQDQTQKMSPLVMPALAYVATVPSFLKRLGAKGFDPKTQDVNYAPPLKHIKMTWAALRGRL
ncbi:MAG: squalene/phytoene synthase family protein [Maricaulaceae bacterium]